MSTPNYVIELMPTDALINHANALQVERKELTARITELETALSVANEKEKELRVMEERMLLTLNRASRSLGAFCSDEGWTMEDMNTLDSVDACLSTYSDKKVI